MNTESIINISKMLHELQEALFILNKEDSTPQTRTLMNLVHKATNEWETR